MVVLFQGEATSRRIFVGAEHRHVATVESLMDGTQGNHCVTNGRFMMECLQHPSVPKSGDKEAGKAGDSSTAEEMKAPTLLLAT